MGFADDSQRHRHIPRHHTRPSTSQECPQQLPCHEQSLSRRRYHVRYHVAALTQRTSSTISNVYNTCVHTGFHQPYPPPPAQKFTALDIPGPRNSLITNPSTPCSHMLQAWSDRTLTCPGQPQLHVPRETHLHRFLVLSTYIPISISYCSTVTQLRNHTCPTPHLILEATHPTAGEGTSKHRGTRHTVTGLHSRSQPY